MDAQQELISRFYSAFAARDYQTMNACYHREAEFYDPVFRKLKNNEVRAMWHMLTSNATDLKITFSEITPTSCRWDAWYAFSRTGRKVHNIIQARFEFKDGLILSHTDTFDLWRWSRMALGWSGLLLGWSGYLKHKIHQTAYKSLIKFMANHPEYKA